MASRTWLSGTMLALAAAGAAHLVANGQAHGQDPCHPTSGDIVSMDEATGAELATSSPETGTEASAAGMAAGAVVGTAAGKVQKFQKGVSAAETTLKDAALNKLDGPIEAGAAKVKKPLNAKPVRVATAWVQIGAWLYAGWETLVYGWNWLFGGEDDATVSTPPPSQGKRLTASAASASRDCDLQVLVPSDVNLPANQVETPPLPGQKVDTDPTSATFGSTINTEIPE